MMRTGLTRAPGLCLGPEVRGVSTTGGGGAVDLRQRGPRAGGEEGGCSGLRAQWCALGFPEVGLGGEARGRKRGCVGCVLACLGEVTISVHWSITA